MLGVLARQEIASRYVDHTAMTRALALVVLFCASACASRLPDRFSTPANVYFARNPEQTLDKRGRGFVPLVASNDATPVLQDVVFNTLDVRRRSIWRGSFTTSTNVASVEVRTNLFSIDVPRTGFGKFRFSVDVLDLPPIFIRDYKLRVIARNSAGVASEEDMPLHIR